MRITSTFNLVLLMLIIAILFSVFSYSLGTAIMAKPQYDDYCEPVTPPRPFMKEHNCTDHQPTEELITSCQEQGGRLREEYDEQGCITRYTCETCQQEYEQARERFRLLIFMTMSILGLIAIITTLLIEAGEPVKEWVLNGFLLGGLINLFIGTVMYFGDAPRLARPLIILIELVIVIMVSLKKGERRSTRKKR